MKYLMESLTKFDPAPDYTVRVEFEDGFEAVVDLAPLLGEVLFAPLRDRGFFLSGKLDHGVPVWSDDVDISPGALRAWAEAGRVLSMEETNTWVAENSMASGAHATA